MPVANPLAQHQRTHQPGHAGVDVHHRAAREVDRADGGADDAGGTPHHVGDRAVDQDRPQHHEHAHGAELHAIREGTRDQRRGDDREGHLVHHVDGFGDRQHRRVVGPGAQGERHVHALGDVVGDAVEEQARQVPDIGGGHAGAVGESQAIAHHHPDDRDEAADREGLHQRGQDVLLPHHAGVEQGQAGDGHHQHQGGAGQHPCRIPGVDLRRRVIRPGCAGRQQQGRDDHQQHSKRPAGPRAGPRHPTHLQPPYLEHQPAGWDHPPAKMLAQTPLHRPAGWDHPPAKMLAQTPLHRPAGWDHPPAKMLAEIPLHHPTGRNHRRLELLMTPRRRAGCVAYRHAAGSTV